jgi:hypothetical protein
MERQYVINIQPVEPDSEDLRFKVVRSDEDEGTLADNVILIFTDTLMIGLERIRTYIAEDFSNDPL